MKALQLNGSDHHVKFDKCSLSVQSLDRLDRQGDMRDDSAETLFQPVLQEAPVSSSGKVP